MLSKEEMYVRRIMQVLEHKIPNMNRKAISSIVGDITQADFEKLAETIAVMRAKYLFKVVELTRLDKSELTVKRYAEVRHSKLAFEEAIDSFNQLKRALERGHFRLYEIIDDTDTESDADGQNGE